ncbi:MAG: family 43 glycosylhydrolase [Solobacterium sp.]|nr:family 43 glycosylhydrolase [Solobacterium sp.]
MKNQVFNPYLPNYEYIPDGEPHVFDGRLYIFGSHDQFGGKKFCMNDYVSWSAPADDLSDWRYEGIIYRKTQDPDNPEGSLSMYAPDVAKGPDGRYYLYYGLADQFKLNIAVCDEPAGCYEYYDCVRHEDGVPWGEKEGDIMPFDPAMLVDDDGSIHLYAGQGPMNKVHARFSRGARDSAFHVLLEADMKTMRTEPVRIVPNCLESEGTGFEEHEFFEASSIRKFNGKYYFIYSSVLSNELVYAVSDSPDRNFRYCGTLHSNGDIGLSGSFKAGYISRPDKRIKAYTGNNHGSIVQINGHYYIFGHRHTNASMYSRQGVAEEIFMDENGLFQQAEMTSCGLNGGPLKGTGVYPAAIACNLQSKKGACMSYPTMQTKSHPRLTQDGEDRECDPGQYIANMRNGSLAGFKYFDFESDRPETITLKIRGNADGVMRVYDREDSAVPVSVIRINVKGNKWKDVSSNINVNGKKTPLFFRYEGKGSLDLFSFELTENSQGIDALLPYKNLDIDSQQTMKDITRKNIGGIDDRFVIRDGKIHPFAVVCPGGGYSLVCSFIEGTPIARRLNELGVSVFIVYYRVRRKARFPHPQDDLADAVREILQRADEYCIDQNNYSVWGFSAGGHLAASFGTQNMGYLHYHLPRPKAIILGYPVISMDPSLTHKGTHDNLLTKQAGPSEEDFTSIENHVTNTCPPVYLWYSDADQEVNPANSRLMEKALHDAGVPYQCECFPNVPHGAGPATGTAAESWIEQAVEFWLKQ